MEAEISRLSPEAGSNRDRGAAVLGDRHICEPAHLGQRSLHLVMSTSVSHNGASSEALQRVITPLVHVDEADRASRVRGVDRDAELVLETTPERGCWHGWTR
jgi:hypothetical protein